MTDLPVEHRPRPESGAAQPAPEHMPQAETPEPERVPQEGLPEHLEQPPRALDPALLYFVLVAVILLGLNNLAAEVRYTVAWTAMATIAVLFIGLEKIGLEAVSLREVVIGLGMGALIGLPLMGIGAPQLQLLSQKMFGRSGDVLAFQMLTFVMPIAEGLYFRLTVQAVRGPVFTALAGGFWAIALFFPQLFPRLDFSNTTLVALVIAIAFLFVNTIYAYVRRRAGLFASIICQVVVNLLLLFVVRFISG
ncbi:MAG TPA: hypothetical protein VKQ72_01420 [Aggregatilineales bacterium]|nr:hypothetical protein [Aggregatilineales bacterium]